MWPKKPAGDNPVMLFGLKTHWCHPGLSPPPQFILESSSFFHQPQLCRIFTYTVWKSPFTENILIFSFSSSLTGCFHWEQNSSCSPHYKSQCLMVFTRVSNRRAESDHCSRTIINLKLSPLSRSRPVWLQLKELWVNRRPAALLHEDRIIECFHKEISIRMKKQFRFGKCILRVSTVYGWLYNLKSVLLLF